MDSPQSKRRDDHDFALSMENEPFIDKTTRDGSMVTSEKHSFIRSATAPSTPLVSWSRRKLAISHFLTILTSSLFTAIIITSCISQPQSNNLPKTKILTCGSSVEEARALGCHYDVLADLWVPAPCFDNETVSEYKELSPWRGYSDENGTRLLSEREMSESQSHESGYYTPARDHLIHCALMLKRLHKGYVKGRQYLDSNSGDWNHTVHCVGALIQMEKATQAELDELTTVTYVGFSTCEVVL
jgi:hypothetical protein